MKRVTLNLWRRALSTPSSITSPETLRLALLKDLQASQVNVEDVSGGCGAAYAVYVESPLFKGKNMVTQHKMVTSTLREQIKDMHSITIKTKTRRAGCRVAMVTRFFKTILILNTDEGVHNCETLPRRIRVLKSQLMVSWKLNDEIGRLNYSQQFIDMVTRASNFTSSQPHTIDSTDERMNFLNLLSRLGGRAGNQDDDSSTDPSQQGIKKGNKRDREATYSSSSDEDDSVGKDDGADENQLSPIYSQTLPQHGGKLLVKNCIIWQWNEDGFLSNVGQSSTSVTQEERVISGKLVYVKYLLVDHYGRISDLIPRTNETLNEHLFETVIEGRNRVLLPGLIDAHIHVMSTGESAYYLDLYDCHSIQEIQKKLKKHHENNPHLPWIIGVNWDQTNLTRYPTRYDLDAVVPDTPVFLWRACWHIGVANTLALRKGGIDLAQTSFTVPGGEVEIDASGPTGILKETAVKLVLSAQSVKTEIEKEQFIKEGLELCLKSGLTGVQTNDDHSLDAYRDLLKSADGLPLRVFLTPLHEEIFEGTATRTFLLIDSSSVDGPVKESGPILSSQTLKPQQDILIGNESDVTTRDSYLIMDRVKIFTDGSLGAETAAIAEIRENEPILSMAVEEEMKEKDYRGILLHSSSALTQMVRTAKENGFRLEIHCIGDKAADQTLSALENAGCTASDRPVMTHCQVLNSNLIHRMKNIGAIANIQPSFVPTDMRWVMERLSPSQINNSYCWKTLLQRGVWVAGGSDSPIETYSPFRGMYDAIFRVACDCDPDNLEDVFRPSERLTFDEALWLYTIGAAYAANCERILGRIQRGFAADLVMVDPEALDDSRHLKDLEPDLVIVGGDVKYIHPTAGSKGIIVDTAQGAVNHALKRTKTDLTAHQPQRGPYIPGKNGPLTRPALSQSIKGLPRIGGFCACWLKGKFCEEMIYCEPATAGEEALPASTSARR